MTASDVLVHSPAMRAAVRTTYGPPEVVSIEDVAEPVPGDGELLVRVRATTVNRTDCGYRGGTPFIIRFLSGLPRPKVAVLGTEFAGEVEAVGAGVSRFQAGDRVAGYCEGTFGAHAEKMTVAERRLIARIPEDRSFEEAAPSTEGSHYALSFLRRAGMKEGDDVLVYGATGAIGSAAVQLAKSMGLRVTAVCRTEHLELVRGLGADRVVDYTVEDWTRDDQRYDLVIDAVGKSSFLRCRRLLKPKGIYTSSDVGRFWHGPLLALLGPLSPGRKLMFVVPHRDPEGIRYLTGLIESGEFTPVIDRMYPLEQIVEAYRHAESGEKIGNIVITV